MKAYDVPLPIRILVSAGLAAGTIAASAKSEKTPSKVGAGVVGGALTLAYLAWAFGAETRAYDAGST
jgi:hypothetical protein